MIKFIQKIKLWALFKYQDILKMELYTCDSNWEEQQIREELSDVDYQIKRMEIEIC